MRRIFVSNLCNVLAVFHPIVKWDNPPGYTWCLVPISVSGALSGIVPKRYNDLIYILCGIGNNFNYVVTMLQLQPGIKSSFKSFYKAIWVSLSLFALDWCPKPFNSKSEDVKQWFPSLLTSKLPLDLSTSHFFIPSNRRVSPKSKNKTWESYFRIRIPFKQKTYIIQKAPTELKIFIENFHSNSGAKE